MIDREIEGRNEMNGWCEEKEDQGWKKILPKNLKYKKTMTSGYYPNIPT